MPGCMPGSEHCRDARRKLLVVLEAVHAVTMQALSGAGYPGVASMDINANVIPFIGSEEEKMQSETQKILGNFADGEIRMLPVRVSAHCNRVPVVDPTGRPVGILTRDDVLRALARRLRGLGPPDRHRPQIEPD